MERYHTFPGTGDGDEVPALKVSAHNVYGWAAVSDEANPNDIMVMRKDKCGAWVKFEDALKRSRKEYDEGFRAAKDAAVNELFEQTGLAFDRGKEDGLKQGRKEGQVKLDAYKDCDTGVVEDLKHRARQQGFDEGHNAALNSAGVSLLRPYYKDPDGYHLGADHDVIYAYATDNPLGGDDVERMRELGWFQEHDDYDPEESWWAHV